MTYEAWVDGSYGPQGLGIGVAIYHGTERVFVIGAREKKTGTNNVAEYLALNYALQWFIKRKLTNHKIVIHTDSMMVSKQMNGKQALRHGAYVVEAQRARTMLKDFHHLTVKWIPREENQEADELSKL